MITSIDLVQEIFAIDMLTTLKSSLEHHHKYVLRSLLLYGVSIHIMCSQSLRLYGN